MHKFLYDPGVWLVCGEPLYLWYLLAISGFTYHYDNHLFDPYHLVLLLLDGCLSPLAIRTLRFEILIVCGHLNME